MDTQVSRSPEILAPPRDVWKVVAGSQNAVDVISGIKAVEILEPASGPSIIGVTWREPREWPGRDAVEITWTTHAREAPYYETRAKRHGAIYTARLELEAIPKGTRLTMGFSGQPVSLGAKVL
jgi:Polyketide cyclase / dehydrase and lipid transport.